MISIPNNIRFRFRDEDRDAQVIVGLKDYQQLIKTITKRMKVSKEIATDTIHQCFFQEIKRTYGIPSQLTIILDDREILVH